MVCKWCGEDKELHVTYPARADYFQCRSEKAPFVGCAYGCAYEGVNETEKESIKEVRA